MDPVSTPHLWFGWFRADGSYNTIYKKWFNKDPNAR